MPPIADPTSSTEDYKDHGQHAWVDTATDHLSTFAADVDTASYTIARRKLTEGTLPPAAAVRVEEWVNYFKYDYAAPAAGAPFAVHADAAPSPFNPGRHIVRVGVTTTAKSVAEVVYASRNRPLLTCWMVYRVPTGVSRHCCVPSFSAARVMTEKSVAATSWASMKR